MPGLGRKVFTAGEVLTAANTNGYLMDQAVMVFAGTAARSSAIGTPSAGMVTYLDSDDLLYVYDGSAWVLPTAGTASVATTATTATNVAGGSEMAIVYQTASGVTATLGAGTAGYVLQTNGTASAPTWVAVSGGVAGDSDQVVLSGRIFG